MFGIAKLSYEDRTKLFGDQEAAREFIEAVRWPDGPVCPHCGVEGNAYKIEPKKLSSKTRPGLYKCADCRKQFTVTVGTIFEGTKVGLHKWLRAIYLMCASKKGVSANQLCRELGVQYKTAWFMCHRVRKAMETMPRYAKEKGRRLESVGPLCMGRVEVTSRGFAP